MQQEVRPLVAADIIEQLHRQFAILSGKGQTLRVSTFCGLSWVLFLLLWGASALPTPEEGFALSCEEQR